MSAMRPAKTEMQAGGPRPSAAADVADLRERHQRGHVQLDARLGERRTSGQDDSPLVLVTGILT